MTSIQAASAFLLRFAQFFGVFPLDGLYGRNVSKLGFKWISFKTFYSVCVLGGSTFCLWLCVFRAIREGLIISESGGLIFYFGTTAGILKFLDISKHWKTIISEWCDVETAMRSYGPVKLKRRFFIQTLLLMSLALIEHLLFIANNIQVLMDSKSNGTYGDYLTIAFPAFEEVEYTLQKAIFVQVVNILSTFVWNYTDLFIMLISSALALQFRLITKKLKVSRTTERIWTDVRDDYNRINKLTILVDRYVSGLVSISFTCNVLFLCIQLFNSLIPRISVLHSIYFFYSFGFLLGRTAAVIFYAAWINDESLKILSLLNAIPSKYHNVELYRLSQQIHNQPAGITGSHVFMVDRSLLLKVSGTIITIELMLLQFSPDN